MGIFSSKPKQTDTFAPLPEEHAPVALPGYALEPPVETGFAARWQPKFSPQASSQDSPAPSAAPAGAAAAAPPAYAPGSPMATEANSGSPSAPPSVELEPPGYNEVTQRYTLVIRRAPKIPPDVWVNAHLFGVMGEFHVNMLPNTSTDKYNIDLRDTMDKLLKSAEENGWDPQCTTHIYIKNVGTLKFPNFSLANQFAVHWGIDFQGFTPEMLSEMGIKELPRQACLIITADSEDSTNLNLLVCCSKAPRWIHKANVQLIDP